MLLRMEDLADGPTYQAPRSFLAWRAAGVLAIAGVLLGFAAFARDQPTVLRMLMGACGVVILGLAARFVGDWIAGWGFSADDAGLHLAKGRRSTLVRWQEIERVDTQRASARLHLRHPERTVIVPHPPATSRPGEPTWSWGHVDGQWQIVEAGAAPAVDQVDGAWLRSVRLGTAPRGYAREPVEELLARCATTLDAHAAPGGPPPGAELVAPEDVERFEVSMARQGLDPDLVDDVLERVAARLAELRPDTAGADED